MNHPRHLRYMQKTPIFSESDLAPRYRPGDWILLHSDGQRIRIGIGVKVVVVGRVDPHSLWKPDIDLGPFDALRTVSRRHAVMAGNVNSCLLREESPTTNGTYINGNRIVPFSDHFPKFGDVVRFGTVEFILQRATLKDEPPTIAR